MPRIRALTAIVLLFALLFSQDFVPLVRAQDDAAPPTPDQLDQLLAPVALYPDSLLAQITTACTNPQEILDVDNWLIENPNLTGTALTDAAQAAGFDPAFIALVNFPQVVTMMAENIDDYTAIGDAFTADQASVTDSIQRLRAQAYASGALRTNEQLQVEVQQPAGQPVYVIQPVNPQVVYVPVYDPTVVYLRPAGGVVATSLISFGVGIGIGALLVDNRPWGWGGWGWNWGSRRAYYNHAVWGGWGNPYRPPNPWYRPRPVYYRGRPGYGGNWGYRPPNYRPPSVRPITRPSKPWGPGNRPGGNRPSRPSNPRPGTRPGTKPGTTPRPRPDNNKPGTRPDNNKPGTRPDNNKPGTRPGTRPNPDTKPNPGTKPTPGTRPSPGTKPNPDTKPAPGTRPSPGAKPAPDNKPQPKPSQRPSSQPKPAVQPKPDTSKPAAQPKPSQRPQSKPATQKPAPSKSKDQPQPK
jgi:hypothetical protein